jgi:hypothetical protein
MVSPIEIKEEVVEDVALAEKRGRGRPKKEKEPKILQKRGPKTNASLQPGYHKQYYDNNYKGIRNTCPCCFNPNVAVDKINRHMRSNKCLTDCISGVYKNALNKILLEKNKEEFNKFFESLLNKSD